MSDRAPTNGKEGRVLSLDRPASPWVEHLFFPPTFGLILTSALLQPQSFSDKTALVSGWAWEARVNPVDWVAEKTTLSVSVLDGGGLRARWTWLLRVLAITPSCCVSTCE